MYTYVSSDDTAVYFYISSFDITMYHDVSSFDMLTVCSLLYLACEIYSY